MSTLSDFLKFVTIVLVAAGLMVPALARPAGGNQQGGQNHEQEGEHESGNNHEHEHEGENDNDDDPEEQFKATSYLSNPQGSNESLASGKIKIKRKGKVQQFFVKAGNLDPTAHTYTFHMENGKHTADFVLVGQLSACGSQGAQLKLHNGHNQCLPFYAEELAELSVRAVQVRDETGLVCLEGFAPPAKGSLESKSAKKNLQGPCGKGKVKLKSRPKSGKHMFELKLSGQEPGSECSLFVEEPGSSQMVAVAPIPIDGFGNGVFRLQSKMGQLLPCGVPNPRNLSGARLEVRDTTEEPALLQAVLPKLK